jgi:LysR family transcriptional regulator, low CO2-responsive transcriptional regulator
MTPTQARAFLAVATKGSFTEAARSLSVSQPTVTNQIKQIERQYAVELFRRNGRGATLTPVGEQILPSIRSMFGSFEEASTYLGDVKGVRRGHLRVGSYGPYDVVKALGRFHRRFPSVTLSVDFSNSESLAQKLVTYDLDVAVLGRIKRQPKFYSLPFSRPPLIVIAPRNKKWAALKSVSANDLRQEIIVRREPGSTARATHDRFFEKVKIPLERIFQFGSREGIISAVAEGIGVGTIFDEGLVPEDRVVKLAIAGPRIYSRVDLVCLADRRANRLIASFLDVAKDLVGEASNLAHAPE